MNKWKILGISETKDKEIIRNAYRSRLVDVNPEDDAEGFMRLREAYEEALSQADGTSENETADGEENTLINELTALYADFQRRISVEEWEKIFARDEFVSLDTAEDSKHTVLSFLMNHNYIPQKIFKLIVDTFHIKETKSELEEKYPERFIGFILNNAKYGDSINYALFDTDDSDIDEFIRVYYRLDDALSASAIEEEEKYIEELDKFGIYHPYVEISKLCHALHKINSNVNSLQERMEKYGDEIRILQSRAEEILADYRDDVFIMVTCGDFAQARGAYTDAEKYYNMAQEARPDGNAVKGRMGNLYCAIGEYEKAKDIFMELLDINRYNESAHAGLIRANNGLIEKLKEEISKQPEAHKLKLELAWCYYRNNLLQEAIEVLESFAPPDDIICEYHDLLGRNYLYTNQYDKALSSFFVWKNRTEAIPCEDESERSQKIKSRYGYVNYFIGDCYIKLKNYEEARKYLETSMSMEHKLVQSAYEAMCRLEYECENYEACITVCEKTLAREEGFIDAGYEAWMFMAKSFDKLEEYGRAIDACEHAAAIYPYAPEPYLLELEIYWYFDEFDDMRSILARFDGLGCHSDRIDVYRARLFAHDENYAASNEVLLSLSDKRGTENTDLEDYFDVLAILGSNYEDIGDDERALYYYTETLKEEPDNVGLLIRIGGLCHIMGKFDTSISSFDKVLALTDNKRRRNRAFCGKAAALACMNRFEEAKKVFESCEEELGLDDIYVIDHAELLVRMNDLQGCAALLNKCIRELEYSRHVQGCIGNLCCFYGNEGYLDDAYRCFELALEKKPDDYNIYRSMGYVYLDHGMYEEAKNMFAKALELDTGNDSFICGLYLVAIGKTDDVTKPEYQRYIEIAEEQVKDADDAYTYVKKAEFYRGIKKYEEALMAADAALAQKRGRLSLFTEEHEAWAAKGNIYEDMGEYEKALWCYEKALRIFGHHALYEECIRRCRDAN